MRVTLQVESAGSGPKIWLQVGQVIAIGRTQNADHAFPHDLGMSSVHFSVECQTDRIHLRDLGSTNGTFVNGGSVTECDLRNGDIIRAGQSTFRVLIDAPRSSVTSHSGPTDATPIQGPAETAPIPSHGETRATAGPKTLPLPAGSVPPTEPAPPPQQSRPADSTGEAPSPATQIIARTELAASRLSVAPAAPEGRVKRALLDYRMPDGPVGKHWLRPGESTVFGSTERADVMISGDPYLSQRHFQLTVNERACELLDLQSTNGTFVRDERIDRCELDDGAVFRAGQTIFTLSVEGGSTLEKPVFVRASVKRATATAEQLAAVSYETVQCASTMTLFRGSSSTSRPGELAAALATLVPAHLLITGEGLPLMRREGQLLSVYPRDPVAPHAFSADLCAISADRLVDVLPVLWGKNCTVCLFAQTEVPALRTELAELAYGAPGMAGPRDYLPYATPHVLLEWLAHGPPEFVARFFSVVAAVFAEVHQGDRWGIVAPAEFETVLQQAGLIPPKK